MLVHCKHAGLLNVPLLSPLLPENNRPYSSAHLLMQNFRRSATNKPLHHLLQETHTPVLLIEGLLTVLHVVVHLCVSNQHVGDRELEETNCWMGFQNRCSGSMFSEASQREPLFRPICLQMSLLFCFFPNFLSCFLGQKSQNTALPLLTQQPSAAVTISNTNAGPAVPDMSESVCFCAGRGGSAQRLYQTVLVM